MNICILNHYADLPSAAIGTRHYDFACRMVAKGHSVMIISSAVSYVDGVNRGPSRHEGFAASESAGVRLVRLHGLSYKRNNGLGRLLNMAHYGLKAWKVCRKMSPAPDVIVGSTVHHFAGLAAWALARHFKVPFVFEVRDIWPESIMEIGGLPKWHPAVLLFRVLDSFLLSHAAAVITLLPNSVDRLVEGGARRDGVFVIPNGVDFERVPPLNGEAPKKDGAFRVMYAGAFVRANNINLLLKAAQIVQEHSGPDCIEFIFVGAGPEKQRLQAEVGRHNIRNVQFWEPVPKDRIIQTLRQANAFILNLRRSPVYRFGISLNKLFDYLAAGRPIIFGFQDPGCNPVAAAKAGWIVAPDDASAMADAVIKLSELPLEERVQMGRAGHEYVRMNHNVHDLVGRYLHVLEKVTHAADGQGQRSLSRTHN